ncbi:MAG TPA: ABC transporter transmembrane domain-containing protein, partial [Trueperaceae bacterium]|nr:ABC transporter transmembrane domain-containing protein [Trueperaceae bacterium]
MQELRAVWRFTLSLARSLGWRFGLVLLVGLVASLTAGVGLLVMVPLLSLVGVDAGGGTTQVLVEQVGVVLDRFGLTLTAPVLLGLNALVLVATAAVSRYQSVLESRVLEDYVLERRRRLFEAITFANWRHLVGGRASNNVHMLTSEADRSASAGGALIGLITRSFLALAHLVVALAIAPLLTVLVVAAGLALAGATAPLTWRARARGREVSQAYKALFSEISDHLGGLKTVKAYGLEGLTTARFEQRSRETADALVGVTRNHANVGFLLQAGSAVLLSGLVLVALGMPQVT